MATSVILVTGGAGFIGTNFIYSQQSHPERQIINLDKLTYAGTLVTLAGLESDDRHIFVRGDIGDRQRFQGTKSDEPCWFKV
jgi:dTDP-glucose 4,6-dehydratase